MKVKNAVKRSINSTIRAHSPYWECFGGTQETATIAAATALAALAESEEKRDDSDTDVTDVDEVEEQGDDEVKTSPSKPEQEDSGVAEMTRSLTNLSVNESP